MREILVKLVHVFVFGDDAVWYGTIVVLAVCGIGLLILARRIRPSGNTPHCRRCGYNLTGLTSEHCPECGSDLANRRAVVMGRLRRRKIVLMTLGWGLLGGALGMPVYHQAKKVDWYAYYPTSFVIADLDSGSPQRVAVADAELRRRIGERSLNQEELDSIVEACLREQSQSVLRNGVTLPMIELMGLLIANDKLSQKQFDRFLENICTSDMEVRTPIGANRGWPYRVRFTRCRAPSRDIRVTVTDFDIGEEGHMIKHAEFLSPIDCDDNGIVGVHRPVDYIPGVGNHRLEIVIRLEVRDGDKRVLTKRTISLHADLLVLKTDPPNEVRLVRSPELDAQVRAGMHVRPVTVSRFRYEDEWLIESMIDYTGPKTPNIAFDIIAIGDNWNCDVGHITGVGRMMRPLLWSVPEMPPRKFKLWFKCSPDAAMETVDIHEIWGGELNFEMDLDAGTCRLLEEGETERGDAP